MTTSDPAPLIAIACGGTGGHLFPGIAVGEELLRRNCSVMLLISPKEVDQQAVKSAVGMEVRTLPAVGLSGNLIRFLKGYWRSYREARRLYANRRPDAVLAMGGFTSAAPVLAGKHLGAKTFLHESNSIPGRANRWLAHVVNEAFVYFHAASGMLSLQRIRTVGMPVRSQFLEPLDPAAARMALGLQPDKPVLLVMGGSQGAHRINEFAIAALPLLRQRWQDLQFIHLTGADDLTRVQQVYSAAGARAVVRPFLTEMDLAMGAATAAVSRAGASSLAELAALRLPAVLIPYPHAADNHQYYNALAFVEGGAARMVEQDSATPDRLATMLADLLASGPARPQMQDALARWHTPRAAEDIASGILTALGRGANQEARHELKPQAYDERAPSARPLLKVQVHV